MKLSHLDQAGRARMVDVGDKPLMDRTAVATGAIQMSRGAFQQDAEQAVAKGDVLAVSEVAGTLRAERTADVMTPMGPPEPAQVGEQETPDGAPAGGGARAA